MCGFAERFGELLFGDAARLPHRDLKVMLAVIQSENERPPAMRKLKTNAKTLAALATAATLSMLAACSHQPVIPEAKNVKIARENPSSDCQELGRVMGQVKTMSGSIEQAIDDMKLDAARKGANYVRMESTGAMGTSASGTAFKCP